MPSAFAATFTVTDPVDANSDGTCDVQCTLRDAIQAANANAEADTVTFAPSAQVNQLTEAGANEDQAATGDLDVTSAITLDGGGATVDATALGDRVFDVLSGGVLVVDDLTISGGSATSDDGTGNMTPNRGGGVNVRGGATLQITDSTVSNNTATAAGGGIENTGATVTVTGTDFQGNEATGEGDAPGNGGALHAAGAHTTDVTGGEVTDNVAVEGGGFWSGNSGDLSVDGTTFDGNTGNGQDADQGGGAIFTEGTSTATVDGASFSTNTATAGSGSGGAILVSQTSTVTVTGSTFTDNSANRAGGAIEVASASLEVSGSDFDGNDVADGAMPGNGGAIHNGGGDVAVDGGTATGNTAVEGGAFWNGGGGTFSVDGTTFDLNDANGLATASEFQGGGAIFNEGGGVFDVTGATFTDNTASGDTGSGGAILNAQTSTALTVDDSTFTGNSAARAGGAIENAGGTATVDVTDSDFTDNDVAQRAMPGNGGAIHNGGGDVTVDGGTATSNSAVQGGGFWTSGTLDVTGTQFRMNTADEGGALYVDEGGELDLDGVTAIDDDATAGDGNAVFAETGTATAAMGTRLRSDDPGLTCNVPIDTDLGGNRDDDASCFGIEVERFFGQGRTDTAIQISQGEFETGTANAVVLSRPDIFPDALAGTPLAAQEGGPLLLTASTGLEPAVADEIERVLAESGTVFLLGGVEALSEQVEEDAEALGFEVVRYGGFNRFDTAARIATEGLGEPDLTLLADGADFPDAVSAGAAAGANGGAVLLTGSDSLPPETQEYLDRNDDSELFAIGGPAAEAAESTTATPIVGATRIETSVEVAEEFFETVTVVGIAQSDDFPDALAGGAAVAQDLSGGPLLLSDSDDLSEPVADYLESQMDSLVRVTLFGGRDALSEMLEGQVKSIVGDDD